MRVTRRVLEPAAVLVLLAVAFLFYMSLRTAQVPDKDSRDNCFLAYNLLRHGVYSVETVERDTRPAPTTKREPLYPALLALTMKVATGGRISAEQLKIEGRAPGLLRALKTLNVVLMLGLVLATWWSARQFLRRWWLALIVAALIAVNTSLLSTMDEFLTEIPGALFLVLSGSLLQRTAVRRSFAAAILGGLALGALVLTKAVFFYFLVLLAAAVAIRAVGAAWHGARERPGGIARWAVLALVALAVYAPWFARTQLVSRSLQVDQREEEILAIRAEYSTMSWKQYAASFVYFTPAIGEKATRALFGEAVVSVFDRSSPEGFYYKAKHGTGVVQRTAVDEGISLRQAAVRVMARNWPKMALLVLPFAYSGAFVQVGFHVRNTPLPLIWMTLAISALFVPALIFQTVRLVRRPFDNRAVFLVPALYSYLIHALITHYIPRYSLPLIPVFLICLAGAADEIGRRTAGRNANLRLSNGAAREGGRD